jgi:hypothetical protein
MLLSSSMPKQMVRPAYGDEVDRQIEEVEEAEADHQREEDRRHHDPGQLHLSQAQDEKQEEQDQDRDRAADQLAQLVLELLPLVLVDPEHHLGGGARLDPRQRLPQRPADADRVGAAALLHLDLDHVAAVRAHEIGRVLIGGPHLAQLGQGEGTAATVANDRPLHQGDVDRLAQRHQLLEPPVPHRPGAGQLVEPVEGGKDLVGGDPVEVQQAAIEHDLEQRLRAAPHLGVGDAVDRQHLGHDPLLGHLAQLVGRQRRLDTEGEELLGLELLGHERLDGGRGGVGRQIAADGAQLLAQMQPGEVQVDLAAELDLDHRLAGTAGRPHRLDPVHVAHGLFDRPRQGPLHRLGRGPLPAGHHGERGQVDLGQRLDLDPRNGVERQHREGEEDHPGRDRMVDEETGHRSRTRSVSAPGAGVRCDAPAGTGSASRTGSTVWSASGHR